MEDVTAEVGDDISVGDESSQQFALLLRLTQMNGRPLPEGGFTGQVMSQMLHEIAGVVPKEVLVMNDQEVVMEFKEGTPMIGVPMQCMGYCIGGTVPYS